jgi:lipopolysaccharide biosynthesis glycosyltransferase
MSFYYSPFELCCELRGFLHDYILNHTEVQSWIFLDSDILVLRNFDEIFQQIANTLSTKLLHVARNRHPGEGRGPVLLTN